jgi:hypothetical protein
MAQFLGFDCYCMSVQYLASVIAKPNAFAINVYLWSL